MQIRIEAYRSPIGTLQLASDGEALCALSFDENEERLPQALARMFAHSSIGPGVVPDRIHRALDAYFAGEVRAIDDIPVRTRGSEFQQQVWRALRTIPAGTTISYGALAARIGRAGASRAVGLANGSNPVAIVLPCHRVIGSNGMLTGYGGGLDRKRWLLQHELERGLFR